MFVSDACARIMDQIEVEGIFRKAGSTARQKEIRVYLSQFSHLFLSCKPISFVSKK